MEMCFLGMLYDLYFVQLGTGADWDWAAGSYSLEEGHTDGFQGWSGLTCKERQLVASLNDTEGLSYQEILDIITTNDEEKPNGNL